MGYVVFQSRHDLRELWLDQLFDEPADEETLVMLHQGDTVVLALKVTAAQYALLAAQPRAGVQVSKLAAGGDPLKPVYRVEMAFVIATRLHRIYPDWMYAGSGYRLGSTTIYLQPVSDVAEETLLSLRSQPTPSQQPDLP